MLEWFPAQRLVSLSLERPPSNPTVAMQAAPEFAQESFPFRLTKFPNLFDTSNNNHDITFCALPLFCVQLHLAVMERTGKSLQALLEEQGASLAVVQRQLAQSEDAEQGSRRKLTEVCWQQCIAVQISWKASNNPFIHLPLVEFCPC